MTHFLTDAARHLTPYQTPDAVVQYIRQYDYLIANPPMKADETITRQMLLLKYLRRGNNATRCADLLAMDGHRASSRTIQRDIDALRELGLSIEYSKHLDRYVVTTTPYMRNLFAPLLELLRG
jgi:hypothetical protein